MYRIFIDIPLESPSLEEAITKSISVMDIFLQNTCMDNISKLGITQINYRLGDDEDRTPKNYFIIDKQGHAASKKTRVYLTQVLNSDQE